MQDVNRMRHSRGGGAFYETELLWEPSALDEGSLLFPTLHSFSLLYLLDFRYFYNVQIWMWGTKRKRGQNIEKLMEKWQEKQNCNLPCTSKEKELAYLDSPLATAYTTFPPLIEPALLCHNLGVFREDLISLSFPSSSLWFQSLY